MQDEIDREKLAQDVIHALQNPVQSSQPDLKIKELDFSIFHPLMHSLWACRGWPGGRKRHLSMRWEYQWRGKFRAQTWCRAGRHQQVTWYRPDGSSFTCCGDCGKDL